MAKNYFANNPMPSLMTFSTNEVTPEKQQGRFGDTVDAFQSGALSGLGGIFDFVGADGIAQSLYGYADEQNAQMSDRGREAMSKSFVQEDDKGNLEFGEGATDLDTWLLTMANVAGQFASTAVPGAGAAGLAAKGLSLGSKGKIVANAAAMGATGGSAATGQGMEQARQEVGNMPDEVLAQSPLFADVLRGVHANKPELSADQKWDAAKQALSNKVAQEVKTDPKVLLANFGASAIGDPIIGKALTGARLAKSGALRSALKGFVTEGATESAQAGAQQYGINQALQPIDNRDPMKGVVSAGLNEGLAGGGFGAGAGLLGGITNRQQPEQVTPEPTAEPEYTPDPTTEKVKETNSTLGEAMEGMDKHSAEIKRTVENFDIPAVARNAGVTNNVEAGRFGDQFTSPTQEALKTMRNQTVADMVDEASNYIGPTPQDREVITGDVLPPQQSTELTKRPNYTGINGGFIEGESAQINGLLGQPEQPFSVPIDHTLPSPTRQIEDKKIIFGDDNRQAQQQAEQAQALEKQQAEFKAKTNKQNLLPQKDIIFAGNDSGVNVATNGKPFKSEKEAKSSKLARKAKREGLNVEVVPLGNGFGWQVDNAQQESAVTEQPEVNNITEQEEKLPLQPEPEKSTTSTGKKTKAFTPSNKEIEVEYQLVEADELQASNDFSGAVNPNYPKHLQPRARDRQQSQVQVNNIANNPIAEKLTDSVDTDRGAPIVNGNVVESGNGRTIGLKESYRTGKAAAYKQHLLDNAEKLGLTKNQIESMNAPILVRKRLTSMNDQELTQFTVDSNSDAGLSQSPAETAQADASLLTDDDMKVLSIPENGNVLSPENSAFIRAFAQTIGNNEIARYKQSDGQWNSQFAARVNNAIFAKGYNNPQLLADMAESTTQESKNLITALMNVSAKLAETKSFNSDVGSELSNAFADAASLIVKSRQNNTSVDQEVSQGDLLSGDISSHIKSLALALESNIHSGKKMTAILDSIAGKILMDAKNTNQNDIFSGEPKPIDVKGTIENATRKNNENSSDTGTSQDLFARSNEPQGNARGDSSVRGDASRSSRGSGSDRGLAPQENIDDFGEKLGGARKDTWGGFAEKLDDNTDIKTEPLSKSLPQPDYEKMADEGVNPEHLAFIAIARDSIKAKPRSSYKIGAWVKHVENVKSQIKQVLNNEIDTGKAFSALSLSSGYGSLNGAKDAIKVIATAHPSKLKDVAGYRITSGQYSVFKGVEYNPSKTMFNIEKKGTRFNFDSAVDTLAEAQENLAKLIDIENESTTKKGKHSKISTYQNRLTKEIYLGWKGASGILKIKTFKTTGEARNYLENNRDEIEATLQKMKDTPNMRKPINTERSGPERIADNVTPAIFGEAFGFRGVEFGNWVEQGKRQKDLNQAYDSLMDLSEALDIPPEALSLNGQLGLAFGARGKGGKEPAAAHYEPGTVVINLTKKAGSGSLAHEWWHALDNYFGKKRNKTNYITESPYSLPNEEIRPEMARAFKAVMDAINVSDLPERSSKLDERRSKAYWATTIEMTARSFESFIIDKLGKSDISNDYLANVVSDEAWDAAEALGFEEDSTYPYPKKSEQEKINNAYQALFDTIEHKKTDQGVMLFSKSKPKKNAKGMSVKQAQSVADKFIESINGANGLKVKILQSNSEAEKLWRMSLDGATVKGAYSDKTKTVYIIADNIDNVKDLKQTLAHETIAHGGLDTVFTPEQHKAFINRIRKTKGRKAFAQYWRNADKDYRGDDDNVKAEEIFARFVENEPTKGELKYWWNAFKRWIANQFSKLGVNLKEDTEITAMREMMEAIVVGFKSNGGQGIIDYTQDGVIYERNNQHVQGKRGDIREVQEGGVDPTRHNPVQRESAKQQTADNFNVHYAQVAEGEIASGLDVVKTPSDAAHVFSPFRKQAQETFLALVTDKNGKILNLIRHSKGQKTSASVDPLTVAGAVAATNGAANVWFAHNHPSGASDVSSADYQITENLIKVLDGTGINYQGHIIVTEGVKATFFHEGRSDINRELDVKPLVRNKKIPYTERVRRKNKMRDAPSITSSASAKKIIQDVSSDSAIVLLNNQHALIGSISITDKEMRNLREGRRVNRILKAINDTNASATIIKTRDSESAKNVSNFLNGIGSITILDWFGGENFTTSNAEYGGETIKSQGPFYSKTTDTRTAKEKLGLEDSVEETIAERVKEKTKETINTLKNDSFWKRLNEGIFDGLSGIKQAEESVGIVDPNQQGYVSARLASGLADVLHGVFHFGAPKWKDGIIQRKEDTKGLLEVFGGLGDDLNNWLAWMGAQRAEKLAAEGKENNLTQADIDELKALANGKEAEFEAARLEYNKINSAILDVAQEAGLLSTEQRGAFDEEYYVPFFRDMGETDAEMDDIKRMIVEPHTRKGIAGQTAQIKALKGGGQSTKDLLENIIARQSTLIDASLKNKAMMEVTDNLSGTDYMQAEESEAIANLSQTELNKLHRVKVMRNGKAEAYMVSDPSLLRALIHINDIGSKSLFNKIGRSAKRFLTAGITMSPDFIFKNFVRDAAHAWMVNKDGFKFGTDSIQGLKKAFKEDELYRDLIFSGAAFQGGYIHGADPEAAAQQIRRALLAKGLTKSEVKSYLDSLVTNGAQLLEKYKNVSDKAENANRLSTYEAALNAGKSKRQAAYEAKDLMDYSLKGNFALIGTMIDMLPFFNARLQGISKLVRASKAGDNDRVLKVLSANLAMKGMKVAAFSLALAALNDEEDEYQELPDWDKDANWHFFVDGDHFRIPKPFELGIIFGTMPERMLHYGTGTQSGDDVATSVTHAIFSTLALNPIPQAALPVVETIVNKSFFMDSPIEGMADENKQAQDRYSSYTSEAAKAIGNTFNWSPKKIDHLIKGYTGTIGGYVLGASDIIAHGIMGKETADAPVSRLPVVKAFYQGDGPKTNTKFANEFYEALEVTKEAYGSYKRAMELGDTSRQQEIIEEDGDKLRSRIALNRIQRATSKLGKQARAVNDNNNLSGSQKRERLDAIQRQKNALYHQAYVAFNLGEW